ncbi:hypothetical protein P5G86_27020 [Paenibacillus jamilae]|nr:hypothetical protein [Bacillus thuringiensis]MEB4843626.1 hypothetical protein [Paenibacillus jamilae]MEB8628002.1 hypothetical protein [Bacillus cereus]MCR6853415.1 hypothetical protein [Bacillus thuringiensis]MEB9275739.1 hypothetical protein [Bacillus cereus]MEC3040930.1 hypothetical protein [Bacillus cereus]
MDNECRTVMFGHFLDGMRCVKCGGPATPKPYNPVKKRTDQSTTSELAIQVNVDTTEALKQMKEVTEAANECVVALEKLEKLTNKFSGFPQTRINVNADSIVKRINSDTSGIRI